MNKYNKEYYIGLWVWLLGIVSGFGMWLYDDKIDISLAPTPSNILIVAGLYFLFLFGHLITHDALGIIPREKRFKIVGVILSSIAVLGLTICLFYSIVALFSTLMVTQLALYMEKRKAFLVAILVPCLGISIDMAFGRVLDYPVVSYPVVIIYGTFNVLALLAHFHLVSEQASKQEAQQLLRELHATQSLLKATTERNERIRIARDLHDSLGHKLTALSLQLEVASHTVNDNKDDHLKQAKRISKSILSDIRETVSDIRQKDEKELMVALYALKTAIPNLEVVLSIELDESCVDSIQIEVIFRSVQEALTNVAKHSTADTCWITLANNHSDIHIDVKDNGEQVSGLEPGNGLKGMSERVQAIGGHLLYISQKSGFNLHIRLPIELQHSN